MSKPDFELQRRPNEAVFFLHGLGAARAAQALAPEVSAALVYVRWHADGPLAALAWFPPDRLEVRIPAEPPWPDLLCAQLIALAGADGEDPWQARLKDAIARLESWSDSDTDPGGGMEELAAELRSLHDTAPSLAAQQAISSARDALDDGLPPDVIAAALYRARGR